MAIRHIGNPAQAMRQVARQTKMVQTGSPLASTAMTRGRLRIETPDGVVVNTVPGGQAGLRVTGRQTISGTLDGDGTLDWDGPAYIRESLDVTASTRLRGKTTMEDDLTVTSGGKIIAGRLTIDPNTGQGSIIFDNGGQLYSNGSTLQLFIGGNVLQIETDKAWLNGPGGAFSSETSGRYMRHLPPTSATTGLHNVVVDDAGKLWRKAV